MNLRPFDQYFQKQEEPVKSCLDYLRTFILQLHPDLTEAWKYGMPFFCIRNKMFCYLWIHKKYGLPYIGIVDGNKLKHPDLIQEKRARMKILLIDPNKDIPVKKIKSILNEALKLHPVNRKP